MRTEPPADRFRVPGAAITRLLVSFLLALLLWGFVTTQQDPTEERTFPQLPIAVPTLSGDLRIGGRLGTVDLRVAGPRSIVAGIDRAALEPTLDVGTVTGPGDYEVPVVVQLPPAVRVEALDPPRLAIVVDEAASRTVPLTVEGVPPDEGNRRLGAITPEVSEVTVSGPRRLVDEVASVVLPVTIGDRTDNFTGQFVPVARNAAGQQIPEVEIRPRRIMATVEVEARGRSVPVLIQTVGSPAPGYEVGDNAVTPAMALLDGPEAGLADLVSVVTAPVALDGATGPVSKRVGLAALPPGVEVIDPPDGLFTVVIQVGQRGVTQTLADLPVQVDRLGAGLTATTDPPTVSVVLFASEDALAALRGGDVTPRVSAAGLGPGAYRVPLAVEVPPGVQWIRTEPEFVELELRRGPAATPVGGRPRELP